MHMLTSAPVQISVTDQQQLNVSIVEGVESPTTVTAMDEKLSGPKTSTGKSDSVVLFML